MAHNTAFVPRAAALLASAFLGAAGCVGSAPSDPVTGQPDGGGLPPGPDADPAAPDAEPRPPDPTGLSVSGIVRDYFVAGTLPQITIATEGIAPALTATSDAVGSYLLAAVPPGSTFYVSTSALAGYRVTTNEPIYVTDTSVVQDVYAISQADAQRQHTTVGLAVEPLTSMVIADIRLPDGQAASGIPLAAITLTDALGEPVGMGPYVFGSLGDLVLGPEATEAYRGAARVAFLNVPIGTYTLAVDFAIELGGPKLTQVGSVDNGVSLTAVGGGGPGQPPLPGQPTFADNVHTILQKAADGGDGCANCHTLGGVANFLRFDDEPALVLQAIIERGLIDIANPDASLLLAKPMYEVPPNHPNATWLDALDPSYQIVRSWIAQGAAP